MLAGHRGPAGLRERPLCGAVVASRNCKSFHGLTARRRVISRTALLDPLASGNEVSHPPRPRQSSATGEARSRVAGPHRCRWAYLAVGGVGLILGALILDLVLGIDMHVVLSSGILAALAVGISWLLWRILKPK